MAVFVFADPYRLINLDNIVEIFITEDWRDETKWRIGYTPVGSDYHYLPGVYDSEEEARRALMKILAHTVREDEEVLR